jgi:hypothetical protein
MEQGRELPGFVISPPAPLFSNSLTRSLIHRELFDRQEKMGLGQTGKRLRVLLMPADALKRSSLSCFILRKRGKV